MNDPSVGGETFYVRIPNGQEFGPADRDTILTWEAQGRVNETCYVRLHPSGQPTDFTTWKISLTDRPTTSPESSHSLNSKPTGINIFGDQMGRVSIPANQSVIASRSRANLVLILSLCSWLLCVLLLPAPVCALLALGFGVAELRRIKRGEVSGEQVHLVWIGIAVASVNLLFVAIFALYGLIAAIVL